MKILSKQTTVVTQDTYVLQYNKQVYTYIEYVVDNKVIDCNLRSEDGEEVLDPALQEKIQELIDEQNTRV